MLLVDDEEIVRMTTAEMLSELGYTVVQAASAEEALARITGGLRFDALVTDHLMPGKTGAELADEVRALSPTVRVLVISGYAQEAGLPAHIPRLTKPFRRRELAAALMDERT
ncbi:response regulator [Phenylobacterium sp. J426]|nr:response regulator [Phenylobacterium sp. J426]MCR5876671.1 response regulator [Phenylobacterium sp. J426]